MTTDAAMDFIRSTMMPAMSCTNFAAGDYSGAMHPFNGLYVVRYNQHPVMIYSSELDLWVCDSTYAIWAKCIEKKYLLALGFAPLQRVVQKGNVEIAALRMEGRLFT